MKKWTGLLASLILLILIAYDLMGLMVQDTLKRIMRIMPHNSIMDVQLDKFQHGWFSSTAQWSFKMHIPPQTITDKEGHAQTSPALDIDMGLPIIIKHGPFFTLNDGLRFGIGGITTQPETYYGAFIDYLNQITVKYALPSFTMQGKEKANNNDFQFNWHGLSALFHLSANIKNMDSSLKLYGIDGSASDIAFNMGPITHTFNSKQALEWLWVGQSYSNISSLYVTKTSQKIFDLEQLSFLVKSDLTNKALNFNGTLSLQKLIANNQHYGPALLKLSVKNLDPEVMANLNKQTVNILQNGSSTLALFGLTAELPKLLGKGPILELAEMTINLPDGKIIGNFKIALPRTDLNDLSKVMQQTKGEGYFEAPMSITKELLIATIKNNLSKNPQENQASQIPAVVAQTPAPPTTIAPNVDEEAANQANQIEQNLVANGFLKIKDNKYILQFKLENQQLIVNGKLFAPGMLLPKQANQSDMTP